MFKNNLKITLRLFSRNKAYTLINVLGMSTGLAISMLIFLYAKFELSYEKYNPLSDRLVRITMDYMDGETIVEQDCETYPPLGPKMTSEFSEIADFTRVYQIPDKTLKIGQNFYRESKIFAADHSFFKLLHYPLIHGDPDQVFLKPNEIVLTESIALKFFNRTDIIGETIEWEGKMPFQVTGIIRDSPSDTHLKINLLISYPTMLSAFGERIDNWSGNNTLTYLLLHEKVEYDNFTNNLNAFNTQLLDQELIENERVIAQPIQDIHLYSNKSFEVEMNGDASSVFILLGVAFLVIVIAVVNYINLSTAKSLDRAKEVGIKKVIGSSLFQLRTQFFTESFIINVFAGLVAIGIIVLLQGRFRLMAGLPENVNFLTDGIVWGILASIIVVSSILSGIFPAFILSSFKPIEVLKGEFTYSSTGSSLRKGLVIFQFSVTVFLLIQTIAAKEQLSFMREKDLGINLERTIVIRAPQIEQPSENYKTFKNQLLSNTQFQSVSMSTCVPGLPASEMSTTTGINLVEVIEDHNYNFYIYDVDEDFLSTMQMELKAGVNFLADSKNEETVLVNEEAISLWGIPSAEKAIGKKIDMWGRQRIIGGVIKNFHQASAKSAHIPIIFLYRSRFSDFASIRFAPGDVKHKIEVVRKTYEGLFPNSPFNYFFLDQEYDKQYRADEQFQQVFGTLTGLAILIAMLGLFGLVSFTVAKRTKEIGIRKVLGANLSHIILLLSKDFVSLILISMLISIPITYFLVQQWLERYAFRIDLNVWLFLVPSLMVLVISMITISGKTLRISTQNPVSSLRDE